MSKRSFTLVSVKGKSDKISENRFVSSNPSGAARKMFTRLCRDKSIKGVCSFEISLKETTQGSSDKVFTVSYTHLTLPTKA